MGFSLSCREILRLIFMRDETNSESYFWIGLLHGSLLLRDSIVASISACHAEDPGSIPGLGAVGIINNAKQLIRHSPLAGTVWPNLRRMVTSSVSEIFFDYYHNYCHDTKFYMFMRDHSSLWIEDFKGPYECGK